MIYLLKKQVKRAVRKITKKLVSKNIDNPLVKINTISRQEYEDIAKDILIGVTLYTRNNFFCRGVYFIEPISMSFYLIEISVPENMRKKINTFFEYPDNAIYIRDCFLNDVFRNTASEMFGVRH
tara:strand:+ start:91 stop:462 length:372 start_codon:yes stop_codon:yes gene_type:complete